MVITARPAAAASAPASTVRRPSMNGPVPRRQTTTVNAPTGPTTRPHTHSLRLIPAPPQLALLGDAQTWLRACAANGVSKTDAKPRANRIVMGATRPSVIRKAGMPGPNPAGHDLLIDHDDDRGVGQVQAVGAPAEVAQRPRIEQAQERGGMACGQSGQKAGDGWTQGEVDPEQMVERPHRPLQQDHREHGRYPQRARATPTATTSVRALARHDAGGQDAEGEQRGKVRRRLDHEGVQARDVGPDNIHRRHDERDGRQPWRWRSIGAPSAATAGSMT